MNLEIGMGESPSFNMEYIHSDIRYPLPHQEVCFDMCDIPFRDETFDFVMSLNSIEHVSQNQAKKAMSEMHRILKVGGKILIVCPNLLHVAKMLQVSSLEDARNVCILTIYGGQNYGENFHKAGWTPDLMGIDLESAGFREVSITEQETYFIHARGVK